MNAFGIEAERILMDEGPGFSINANDAIVYYAVPVAVHVDLASGTVSRVIVLDEEPTLVHNADPSFAAVTIAQNQSWPAWEFGH